MPESKSTSEELNNVNPLQIIAIADAAFDLLEKALVAIDELKKNGAVITPEQQLALQAKYESLINRADSQFSGDHWKIDPPPAVQSPAVAPESD